MCTFEQKVQKEEVEEREEGVSDSEEEREEEQEGGSSHHPTIPPGYHRGIYSILRMVDPPAPGLHHDADRKVDVTAAHARRAEVPAEGSPGSER